jgi:hypothetical protein
MVWKRTQIPLERYAERQMDVVWRLDSSLPKFHGYRQAQSQPEPSEMREKAAQAEGAIVQVAGDLEVTSRCSLELNDHASHCFTWWAV